mgnify:CR=1 FL=1
MVTLVLVSWFNALAVIKNRILKLHRRKNIYVSKHFLLFLILVTRLRVNFISRIKSSKLCPFSLTPWASCSDPVNYLIFFTPTIKEPHFIFYILGTILLNLTLWRSTITFPTVARIHLVPLVLNKENNVCTFQISLYLDP